ncbi:DNA recombination protein RmuC [Paracoccaceae bacterium GXU_MW_L88]
MNEVFSDPVMIAGAIALLVVCVMLLAIVLGLRSMSGAVRRLNDGQLQLTGGLNHVSEAQARTQAEMVRTMEGRLDQVKLQMENSLHGSARRTAHSLGELQQRLTAIDKAQANIEKLSGDVLGLQDILSNKQTRGAFGEIQLRDIVTKALPPDAFSMQATLSNGKRADCLLHMPDPPGPIVIDAKFPLEAYEALRNAQTEREKTEAARHMRTAIRTHIKAISEKYIVAGETADSALMFLPSEAVYAELHANFPELVREGFQARVWTVSPTTCMAVLNTLRAVLKDVRMREQAGVIRSELALLAKDVERLETRVGNLGRHFEQARKDVDEISISAQKAGKRTRKLEDMEFDPKPAVESEEIPGVRRLQVKR